MDGEARAEAVLLAAPWLLLNLSCEMIFILHSRLDSNSADVRKSQRIVDDLVQTLVEPCNFSETLRPHALSSLAAAKASFSRLAHCSIARLEKGSMSKLFSLMVMSVKTMLMMCRNPQQMVEILPTRLGVLESMASPSLVPALLLCKEKATELFKSLAQLQLQSVRQELCLILQGLTTKVTPLISTGLQNLGGFISVRGEGAALPDQFCAGTVRYFAGKKVTVAQAGKAAHQEGPDPRWPVELGGDLYGSTHPRGGLAKIIQLEADQERIWCRSLGGAELVVSFQDVKDLEDLKKQIAAHFGVKPRSLVLLKEGAQLRQFHCTDLKGLLSGEGNAPQAIPDRPALPWLVRETTKELEAALPAFEVPPEAPATAPAAADAAAATADAAPAANAADAAPAANAAPEAPPEAPEAPPDAPEATAPPKAAAKRSAICSLL
ncbi:unnamed protein product [Effrenium voratum]|uniref:Uncharacterized protein n=2 Tax=Effrenium voratum TaxID=2562239 RepID=A0AA36IYQ4_9DINO|nr:unnamed protein product [Effrenium voratum]